MVPPERLNLLLLELYTICVNSLSKESLASTYNFRLAFAAFVYEFAPIDTEFAVSNDTCANVEAPLAVVYEAFACAYAALA